MSMKNNNKSLSSFKFQPSSPFLSTSSPQLYLSSHELCPTCNRPFNNSTDVLVVPRRPSSSSIIATTSSSPYLPGEIWPPLRPPSRSYRCDACQVDFPNAQAFGGHMSSHSKASRKAKDASKAKVRAFDLNVAAESD